MGFASEVVAELYEEDSPLNQEWKLAPGNKSQIERIHTIVPYPICRPEKGDYSPVLGTSVPQAEEALNWLEDSYEPENLIEDISPDNQLTYPELGKDYSKTPLFVGSLLHLAVQDAANALPASLNKVTRMPDFKERIDTHFSTTRRSDAVYARINALGASVAESLGSRTPQGFREAYALGEVSIMPGIQQVAILKHVLEATLAGPVVNTPELENTPQLETQSANFNPLVAEWGFNDIHELFSAVVADPYFRIDLSNSSDPYLARQGIVSLDQIIELSRKKSLPTKYHNEFLNREVTLAEILKMGEPESQVYLNDYINKAFKSGKLDINYLMLKAIASITTYYDLNMKQDLPADLSKVPDEFLHMLFTTKSKCDLLYVDVIEDDTEAQEIADKFKATVGGNFFGRRRLLDFSKIADLDDFVGTVKQFLNLCKQKRISLRLYEIKTDSVIHDQKYREPEVTQFLNLVSGGDLSDTSYTVLALEQLFRGALDRAWDTNINQPLTPKPPAGAFLDLFSEVAAVKVYAPVLQIYETYGGDIEYDFVPRPDASRFNILPIAKDKLQAGLTATAVRMVDNASKGKANVKPPYNVHRTSSVEKIPF